MKKVITSMTMKPIPDFPGYFATEEGRIYSEYSGKCLQPRLSPKGYFRVNLRRDGKNHTHEVHVLVARAWFGEPGPGERVLHGAEGKYDNSVGNLRYGTQRENMLDRHRDGTMVRGGSVWCAKLTDSDVKEIRELYDTGGFSYARLAELFEVSATTIRDTISGRYWSHVE